MGDKKTMLSSIKKTQTQKHEESKIYMTNANAKRCRFCTLDIVDDSRAVGCPIKAVEIHNDIKHDDIKHSGEYITKGIFCSYNCAKAFAKDREAIDPTFAKSCRFINIIVNKNVDGESIDVHPSPPIELMRLYGGYMTEEQYRSEIGNISYTFSNSMVTHPITLVYQRKIH